MLDEVIDTKTKDSTSFPDWFIGLTGESDDVCDFLTARRLAEIDSLRPAD